jgi:hypothetical protein
MARMPGAQWLGEHSPGTPMSRYDIVCIHTIVGHPPAHAAHFSTEASGHIYQSRDTKFRSAANLEGNHRVIAIENEDMGAPFPEWGGDGRKVPPLTDEQVTACAEILAWAHKTHGVPLQLCPDSRPGSRGLAYHRQGIDGNFGPFRFGGRVAGGETWTLSPGKVCPGDARIAQLPEILVRARRLVDSTPQELSMNHVEAALVPLNTSNRTLTRAVAELQKVPTKRVRVRAQIAGLVVARTTIRAAIRSLEKLK